MKYKIRAGQAFTPPPELSPGTQFATEWGGRKYVAEVGYAPAWCRDWAAYVGPAEWTDEHVAARGDKISEDLAKLLFPQCKQLCYRL